MVISSQSGLKPSMGGPGAASQALMYHAAVSPPITHSTYPSSNFGEEEFVAPPVLNTSVNSHAQLPRVNVTPQPNPYHPNTLSPGHPRPPQSYQYQGYPGQSFVLYPQNGLQQLHQPPGRPVGPNGLPFPEGYQLNATPTQQDQSPFLSVEPHFPPQNFEIPDIQVSNSVMSGDQANWDAEQMSITGSPQGGVKVAGSPPGSSSGGSPGTGRESAVEDNSSSDDSLPLAQLAQKRPADQVNASSVKITAAPTPAKKAKAPKKRKKRDPNEPQKPVSAYALFFRDTQAAIKSRNPSASFGEVSKIVASMWDGLEEDHKNIYKKRTETAKKEYLKQLAAYRASLVSQGGTDTSSESNSERNHGNNNNNGQPGVIPDVMATSQPVPMTMLNTMATVGLATTCNTSSVAHTDVSNSLVTHVPSTPQHPNPAQQTMLHGNIANVMTGRVPQSLSATTPASPMQGMNVMTSHINMPVMTSNQMVNNQMMGPSIGAGMAGGCASRCIRQGCTNLAIENPGWDYEYCSNECVVNHCRDVFTTWVANGTQSPGGYASVK